MRINVYDKATSTKGIRVRKFVKNVFEAQSFCDWYKKNYGTEVYYVICR